MLRGRDISRTAASEDLVVSGFLLAKQHVFVQLRFSNLGMCSVFFTPGASVQEPVDAPSNAADAGDGAARQEQWKRIWHGFVTPCTAPQTFLEKLFERFMG